MIGDGRAFEDAMNRWASLTQNQLEQLARQSIQEMATRIKFNTRVDTGALRSHWQVSFGAPAPPRDGKAVEANPAAYDTDVSLALSRLQIGMTVFYSNSAAYAARMEYGFVGVDSLGRSYNQRGDFNVRTHVTQWPVIVASTADALGLTR